MKTLLRTLNRIGLAPRTQIGSSLITLTLLLALPLMAANTAPDGQQNTGAGPAMTEIGNAEALRAWDADWTVEDAAAAAITPVKKVEAPAALPSGPASPSLINAGTYVFSNSSGAALEDMSSGTTLLVAADIDDSASAVTPIGFDFWFDGVRQTQFSVNANGLIRLGVAAVAATFDNSASGLASATDTPKIAPYFDDLWNGNNGKVHFKVVGSAPNRRLVIEWQNEQIPRVATANPGAGTFQAWLYESSGVIEFVYGSGIALNTTNSGASIGLSSSATSFASVTAGAVPTVSYVTANNLNTVAIASGTKYTFTPLMPTTAGALSFTAVGLNTMTLNWADVSNEFGYAIYRSVDGVNYEFVRQVAANTTSSVETGLASNTTWFWRVFPVSEGAAAAPSSGSQATLTGTVSGTRTIGPTGTYASIGAAVTDINTNGLAGNVILELQAAYDSSFEPAFPVSISTLGSPSNTITIRPETGATALSITGPSAISALDLNLATNVIIDGRAGGVGPSQLTIINPLTTGVTLRFVNGASRNTIRFVSIRGVNTSTTGGVVLFSALAGVTGNNNNTIDSCEIRDGATTPVNGITSIGTSSTSQLNTGNVITNNNIFNFFSATLATNGILVTTNTNMSNTGWTISNNRIFQTAARNYTTTNTHRGIFVNGGSDYNISGNVIGFGAANGTGTYTMTSTGVATAFFGIVATVGDGQNSIQGNTVAGISLGTTTGTLAGISLTAGSANIGTITGNTVGSGTGNGSLASTSTTSAAFMLGLNVSGTAAGTVNVANNTVGSFTSTGSPATINPNINVVQILGGQVTFTNNLLGSATTANSIQTTTAGTSGTNQQLIGMLTGTTSPLTISGNTVANLTNAGTGTVHVNRAIQFQSPGVSATASGGRISIVNNIVHDINGSSANTFPGSTNGIFVTTGTGGAPSGGVIDQNTVYAIKANNAGAVATGPVGIVLTGNSATIGVTGGVVSRNKVYDIRNASTMAVATTPPVAAGIFVQTATTFAQVVNNMVSLGNAQATNTEFIGVWNNFAMVPTFRSWYNSVHIEGAAAAGALPSYGFLRGDNTVASAVTSPVDLKDNIFNNTRTGGTGKHYAIGNVNTTPATGWSAAASNNNALNSPVAATVGIWGLATDQTIGQWQTSSGGDGASPSGFAVPFTAPATGDLHLSGASAVNNAGTPVVGVTTDFDNDTRSATTPEIGADEVNSTTPITVTIVPASLSQVYTGAVRTVSLLSSPPGFENCYDVNYTGGHINAGSYPVAVVFNATTCPANSDPVGANGTLVITPAGQTITFTSTPPSPGVVGSGYTVTATGGASGNPVTFGSSTPAVCTVSGSLVTPVGPGTCTVTADQAASANYSAAPQATQNFLVVAQTPNDLLRDPTLGTLIPDQPTKDSHFPITAVEVANYTCGGPFPNETADYASLTPVIFYQLRGTSQNLLVGKNVPQGKVVLACRSDVITTITSGPAPITNQTSATFTFTSSPPAASYECSVDGAAFAPCSTPLLIPGPLGAGPHNFRVHGLDGGSQPGVDATYFWTIDLTPPNAPTVYGTTPTTNRTPTWFWTSGGGGGNGNYRVKLDDGTCDFTSGTIIPVAGSSFTPGAPLNVGGHILCVEERDTAGNYSAPGSFTITIDPGTPASVILTSPDAAFTGTFYAGASVTATGFLGEDISACYLLTYTGDNAPGAPVLVGSYTVTATFSAAAAPVCANYTDPASPYNSNFAITPASPAFVNLTASQIMTYGTPSLSLSGDLLAGTLPATGDITVNINDTVIVTLDPAGHFSFDYFFLPDLNASVIPYLITYSYAATPNFNAASNNATSVTVNKATPVLCWNNPADITYPTPLGPGQLNASVCAVAGPGNVTLGIGTTGYVVRDGSGSSFFNATIPLPANASTVTTGNPSGYGAFNKLSFGDDFFGLLVTDNAWTGPSGNPGTVTFTFEIHDQQANTWQTVCSQPIDVPVFLNAKHAKPVDPAKRAEFMKRFETRSAERLAARRAKLAGGTSVNGYDFKTGVLVKPAGGGAFRKDGRSVEDTLAGDCGLAVYNYYNYYYSINYALPFDTTFAFPQTANVDQVRFSNDSTVTGFFYGFNGFGYTGVAPRGLGTITLSDAAPLALNGAGAGRRATPQTPTLIGGLPAGTFVYSPAAGAVLDAGPGQSLNVTFHPTDLNNYNDNAGKTVQINVQGATPVFSNLSSSQTIIYGTPSISLSGDLKAGITPATGSVAVTINGDTQTASLDPAGHFALTFLFLPVDIDASATPYTIAYAYTANGNFNGANDSSTTVTVSKATPVICWNDPADITHPAPLGAAQLNANICAVGGPGNVSLGIGTTGYVARDGSGSSFFNATIPLPANLSLAAGGASYGSFSRLSFSDDFYGLLIVDNAWSGPAASPGIVTYKFEVHDSGTNTWQEVCTQPIDVPAFLNARTAKPVDPAKRAEFLKRFESRSAERLAARRAKLAGGTSASGYDFKTGVLVKPASGGAFRKGGRSVEDTLSGDCGLAVYYYYNDYYALNYALPYDVTFGFPQTSNVDQVRFSNDSSATGYFYGFNGFGYTGVAPYGKGTITLSNDPPAPTVTYSLYGVTGNSGPAQETLFRLDQSTAAATLVGALPAANDGETVASLGPSLYRLSGQPSFDSLRFDRIDFPFSTTNIPRSGVPMKEGGGMTASGSDFLVSTSFTNAGSPSLYRLTAGGVSSLIGAMDHRSKGLAFNLAGTTLYSVSPQNSALRTIDANTGATLSSIPMTSGLGTITAATGLATHPGTGVLYVLIKIGAGNVRHLATVDPATGVTTDIGLADDGNGQTFAGIAFLQNPGPAQLAMNRGRPKAPTLIGGLPTGSFVYTPAAGTVLNAGTNQALNVVFHPTDLNNYNDNAGKTVHINVSAGSQTITFNTLADKVIVDPDFPVSATASSGLTVSFSSTTPAVCTVAGATVTLVTTGNCTIRASQPGDANYGPAPDVDQTFRVFPNDGSILQLPDNQSTTNWTPMNGNVLLMHLDDTPVVNGTVIADTSGNGGNGQFVFP